MTLFFEFLPVLLFFAAFKLWGLMVATAVLIAATTVQVIVSWVRTRTIKWMQLVTAGAVLVFGGITLALDNELFIKWKPTIVYALIALVFVASHWIGGRPVIRRMLEASVSLPDRIWARLSALWVVFFLAVGALNLWVAYNFDTDTWVNFKLIAAIGLPIAFAIAQGFYIARHAQEPTP
ncbi:MAG: septation protein A [Gammaproteobacteria bacterium]